MNQNHNSTFPHSETPLAGDFLSHARFYLERGFSVIPLNPRSKKPCAAAIPSGGWKVFQEEKPRPEQVERWWGGDDLDPPGLAIVLGRVSNLVVLDFDRPDVDHAVAEVFGEGRELPHTARVRTRRGFHYYFCLPAGVNIGNSKLGILVDLKGEGGYVVAPPSVHETGHVYAWDSPPWETPIAELPHWVLEKCAGGRRTALPPTVVSPAARDAVLPSDEFIEATFEGTIARLVAKVREAPEGDRNNTLFQVSADAGRLVLAHRADWDTVAERLRQAAEEAGLEPSEIGPTINSGWRKARENPPHLHWGEPKALSVEYAERLNSLELNDEGNAEAFLRIYGENVRYLHDLQTWHFWNGLRWRDNPQVELRAAAGQAMKARALAANLCRDEKKRKKLAAHANRSRSLRAEKSLLEIAEARPSVRSQLSEWDNDPFLLGCPNGVVDLKQGELLEPDRRHKVILSAGVPFHPDATCPRWERFLEEVFRGDQSLIAYVQRAIGYSLTGSTREQCLFICHGSGANGKSVFLSVLQPVFGDYAKVANFTTLDRRNQENGGAAAPDVYALKGPRLVTVNEAPESALFNEARIKSLTGSDKITARPLYGPPVTFTPAFKLWIAVNHLPSIREDSHAIWRRIRVVPFTERFDHNPDLDLLDKLQAEGDGILAWAVRGCLNWLEEGLNPPAPVMRATEDYRESTDIVGRFIGERCITSSEASVRCADLYAAFVKWCEVNGEKPFSHRKFGERLVQRGIERHRTNTARAYRGLGLLDGHDEAFRSPL